MTGGMIELVFALAVAVAPAAPAMGQAGGQVLARAVARVAVPAASVCKPERPRSGWIGVPPKTTGHRAW